LDLQLKKELAFLFIFIGKYNTNIQFVDFQKWR